MRALQQVHDEQARNVEEHRREGVGLPGHFLLRVDAKDAVDQALGGSEDPLRELRLALVYARHVAAQRLRDRDQKDAVQRNLKDGVGGHEKFSGFSIANIR